MEICHGTPLLYRAVAIPPEMLAHEGGRAFGGDLRIGDLTGDGQAEFVVYRCTDGGMKPCFMGAFDMYGQPLWTAGEGGEQPARPMSVAVHDIDGDGNAEVICFWDSGDIQADETSLADVVVQIRDGQSGQVKREAALAEITGRRGEGPNWVHQRLLICNLRGTDTPRDFIVKLGDTIVGIDESLQVLWTYTNEWTEYGKCPAYIPSVGDINGDGRDEVNAGYFLLGSDGAPLWERPVGDNMDSVAIVEWDEGNMRAICSGFGQILDASGGTILCLGPELVPHGQEVRVADFRSDLPGPEMLIRFYGHNTGVLLISSESSEVVAEFSLNESPNNTGMEPILWQGPTGVALLFNGGWLWDVEKTSGAPLPDLPPPSGLDVHKMGWHHGIAANVCGDEREEIVTYDPCAAHVYIYTAAPLEEAAFAGYFPGPRQYNPRLMD